MSSYVIGALKLVQAAEAKILCLQSSPKMISHRHYETILNLSLELCGSISYYFQIIHLQSGSWWKLQVSSSNQESFSHFGKSPPELLSQAEQHQSSLARSVKCVFSRPTSVQDETKRQIPIISNWNPIWGHLIASFYWLTVTKHEALTIKANRYS